MRLKAQEKAPYFSVEDSQGRKIQLDSFQGKKVLLSFNRYASCPFCNLHIHTLQENYPRLQEKGVEILAFFQSPKESLMRYVGRKMPPFPLIPDPGRQVYALYKVESSWIKYLKAGFKIGKMWQALKLGFRPGKMEGDLALVPADFLISEKQIILLAHYGRDISDNVSIKDLEKFL